MLMCYWSAKLSQIFCVWAKISKMAECNTEIDDESAISQAPAILFNVVKGVQDLAVEGGVKPYTETL